MKLRPGLRWGLGSAVVASAAALLWPGDDVVSTVASPLAGPEDVAASAPLSTGFGESSAVAVNTPTPERTLVRRLHSTALEPAHFDPFVGVASPPPPSPPPPPAAPAPPPPPPPVAPAPVYRFLGRMNGPGGVETVYLIQGDNAVPIVPGMRLDDGWVVEAITKEEVALHYPSMDAHARIPIPLSADSSPR